MRSSEEALLDQRVHNSIRKIARRYVITFSGRYPMTSSSHSATIDEVYWEAKQDAFVHLATHYSLYEGAIESGDWLSFERNLYKAALHDKRMSMFRKRRIESLSTFSSSTERLLCNTHATRSPVHDDLVGGYTEDDIRRLAVLCWEPERLSSNKDPFGENIPHEDDPFWRKATSDPSHRGTEIAEMIDMRSAFHWIEGDKYHNPAKLTKPEIRAFYTVCVEDMTFRSAARSSSRDESSIRESLDKALSKLVTYMNNPKGRRDDE